jgi:hypothetical protein
MESTAQLINKENGNYSSQINFNGNTPVTVLIAFFKKQAKGWEMEAAQFLSESHDPLELDAAINALTINDLGGPKLFL